MISEILNSYYYFIPKTNLLMADKAKKILLKNAEKRQEMLP